MKTLEKAGSCKPEREGLIPSTGAALEKQVGVLEELFGYLVERLHCVRTEEVETNRKESERPPEAGLPCQLAEHLRQQTARIRAVCDRIEYQLSVLET